MAKQLIDSLSTDFDAGKYRDEYREELLALLEQRPRARRWSPRSRGARSRRRRLT